MHGGPTRLQPWTETPETLATRGGPTPTSKERTRASCRPSPATSDHGCSDLDQLLLLLLQVDEDEPSLMAAAAAYSLLLPPGLV